MLFLLSRLQITHGQASWNKTLARFYVTSFHQASAPDIRQLNRARPVLPATWKLFSRLMEKANGRKSGARGHSRLFVRLLG